MPMPVDANTIRYRLRGTWLPQSDKENQGDTRRNRSLGTLLGYHGNSPSRNFVASRERGHLKN